MRYDLGSGIIVKTENAAKPESQGSAYLRDILLKLPHVPQSFDYGCGKLRYTSSILRRTDFLALVDSEVQLSRTQMVRGHKETIRSHLRRSNRLAAYNDKQFQRLSSRFDRGFCINVLSVIPVIKRRRHVLSLIRSHLKPGASCLFVVQYRNSDFTRMSKMDNARPWRDGYLINSLRGYSFYGLIRPERLEALVESEGFEVKELKLHEGSAFLWAAPRNRRN